MATSGGRGPADGRAGASDGADPPRVFINYRRDDASGHAGRLYDALADRFGTERVFMDVDAIRPGENFATVLDQSVGSCDVLIALIGQRWVSAVDREGRRRLARPEDYVRLELQTALTSSHTRVIPALVQGAEMPTSDQLPAALQPLAMRQAIELSDGRWRSDVARLIRDLEGAPPEADTSVFDRVASRTGPAGASGGDGRDHHAAGGGHRTLVVAAALAAVAAAGAAVAVALGGSGGGGGGGGTTSAGPGRNQAVVIPTPTATTATTGTTEATPTTSTTPTTPEVRYVPYEAEGYQARLPAGDDWSRPAQTSYGEGRRVRTIVRGPAGAFVAVDYTPRDKPTFGAPYESKRELVLAAFGPATRYVFRGGGVAECTQWRCVDYQVSIPGTEGGLGVVAGGPDFAQSSDLAREVAQSLTPAAGG